MNISSLLAEQALKSPFKKAVTFPAKNNLKNQFCYNHYTFSQLEEMVNRYAHALSEQGVKKGTKVLLFLRPNPDFSAITFALFRMGAIPIFMDPGMGKTNLLNGIKEVCPEVLIAENEVHLLRRIYAKNFKSIRLFFSPSRFSFPLATSLFSLALSMENKKFETVVMDKYELGAILFTSGGTGKPKGVEYTHGMLYAQTFLLKELFSLTESEVDMPGFPLFSLFTIVLGMTSCIPRMNPSKPGKANPAFLVKTIQDQGVTFAAGSPAIWEKVADYCLKNKLELPSLKYVVMFGAPVSLKIHEKFQTILPNGDTYTPYGATEGLPVSCAKGSELLIQTAEKSKSGHGICIGKNCPAVEVKVIAETNTEINDLSEASILSPGMVGEIIVNGEGISKSYYRLSEETRLSKIKEGEKTWHRMGDLGYLDNEGQLWFCGRKTHKVLAGEKNYYSIPCESIVNQHPLVKRSALIGLGEGEQKIPAIVIERFDHKVNLEKSERDNFIQEIKALTFRYPHTEKINEFFFYDHFPVDGRHNIKIDRLRLKTEIENQLAKKGTGKSL